jgi:hypothetical protein
MIEGRAGKPTIDELSIPRTYVFQQNKTPNVDWTTNEQTPSVGCGTTEQSKQPS